MQEEVEDQKDTVKVYEMINVMCEAKGEKELNI